MPLPTDRCRLLPVASASALALAAALGAGAALAASPATASGRAHTTAPQDPRESTVRVGTGTADFCLTPDATRALTKAGIRLTAVAPAKLTGPAGRRCVSAPISGGAFNTRFTSGHLAFGGGFDFVRKDKRHLRVDALRGELATSRLTANVGGSKARRADFLAFRVDPNRIKMGGGQVRARMSFTLTERGAAAFRGTFQGRSPLAAGQRVFDGDGTARLANQAAGSTSPGTGTAQKQTPATAQKQPPATTEKQTPGTPTPQKQNPGTPKKQTQGTPQKQTPTTAQKQPQGTAQKQTPGTPQKQTPTTTHNQRPTTTQAQQPTTAQGQRPTTTHNQRPTTTQGETPAVTTRPVNDPAVDPAVDPVNDVAMSPLNAVAAD
ncbi:hypothetical protein A6A06_17835 [Streptomyces sp. CB02923]|uniref:hypothetical protein n=1 Tax=Streptomyces sp. CB02923 TaxID=1718985 RepID=UPI00093C693C|nr:hypothetical protein [Streptomyces sp. CB02923]OKI00787.1 hypothetical protein A6A06_17835 [Streptomyces sp. CB02923]